MFTNGRHPYNGKTNSRSQRRNSKVLKGMNLDKVALYNAFDQIKKERHERRKDK